ncbi:MAG TPA: hypothetical protein VGC62_08775 [Pseudomonas sp.]|uniref:hypothetical protein n=1 Tax=Pseudomonas sp. TaxID=306 RepID=UPI002ED9B702
MGRLISVSEQAAVNTRNVVKTNVTRLRAQMGRMQNLIDGGLMRMESVVIQMPETTPMPYLIRGAKIKPYTPAGSRSLFKSAFSEWSIADSVASLSGGMTIVSTVMGENDLDPTIIGRPASISGAAASLTAIGIDQRFATLQKFPRVFSPLKFR